MTKRKTRKGGCTTSSLKDILQFLVDNAGKWIRVIDIRNNLFMDWKTVKNGLETLEWMDNLQGIGRIQTKSEGNGVLWSYFKTNRRKR